MKNTLNALDSPGGHIAVGLLLVGVLIGVKASGLNGGLDNLLSGLVGISLARSLQKANDGQ